MLFKPGTITSLSNSKFINLLNNSINDLDKKNILDFGVGSNKLYKLMRYNKYFIYDKIDNFSNFHNSNENIIFLKDYKNIKDHIDIIFFNSVIQYIDINELNFIFSFLKNMNKVKIIINDVPKYNRYIEFFSIFFQNFIYSPLIYKNIFENIFFQKTLRHKFYFHKKHELIDLFVKLGFEVIIKNNYYINNCRYTLVLNKI